MAEVGSPYAVKVDEHEMSLKFAGVVSDTPTCLAGMNGEGTGYAAETGKGNLKEGEGRTSHVPCDFQPLSPRVTAVTSPRE